MTLQTRHVGCPAMQAVTAFVLSNVAQAQAQAVNLTLPRSTPERIHLSAQQPQVTKGCFMQG